MTQAVQRVVTVAVLPTLEKSMRASITSTTEPLATSVGTALRDPLLAQFRQLFLEGVVPALESSTRAMLVQIHETISRSINSRQITDEHSHTPTHTSSSLSTSSTSSHGGHGHGHGHDDQWRREQLDHDRKQSASIHDLRATVARLEENQAILLKTMSGMAEQMASQTKMLRDMQVALATSSTNSGNSGSGGSGNNNTGHMSHGGMSMPPSSPSPSSNATTATPPVVRDPREEMDRLLRANQYESAFVVALSSGRLELVTWICSRLDPAHIFSGNGGMAQAGIRLSSPVVLSLIQQLSFQLSTRAAMALAWLQHAFVALEPKDPSIAAHVPSVISDFIRQLDDYTTSITNPNDPILTTAKFVRHSARALLL
jgi:hypothetical protein